jgi:hypothetical protein
MVVNLFLRIQKRLIAMGLLRLGDEMFARLLSRSLSSDSPLSAFKQSSRNNFLFNSSNQKEFFLNLLTRVKPYELILEDADAALSRIIQSAQPNRLETSLVWPLGKAYWLTRNGQYVEAFRLLTERRQRGSDSRAYDLIAGYYFFSDAQQLAEQCWLNVLPELYADGLMLERKLRRSAPNAREANESSDLFMLGIFFRSTPDGRRWLKLGQERLEELFGIAQPDVQVDTLRLLATVYRLAGINGVPFSRAFSGFLERAFEQRLRFEDERELQVIGGLLFERRDCFDAETEFSEEALWLFGAEGFERYLRFRQR